MSPNKRKPESARKFTIGQEIRVKPGVKDPDYPDMPLGGWTGTVDQLDPEGHGTCRIRWDRRTLDSIDPVYKKRCERDGLDYDVMWLSEDCLEPATGDLPPIEQPTNIRAKPLNAQDQHDRVRIALGLTGDDPLPDVDEQTLRAYHAYLSCQLNFPFEAKAEPEHGPRLRFTVLRLLDPGEHELDEFYGLLCQGRAGRRMVEMPVAELEVDGGTANGRLISDYSYWFWNYR